MLYITGMSYVVHNRNVLCCIHITFQAKEREELERLTDFDAIRANEEKDKELEKERTFAEACICYLALCLLS